MNRYVLPLILGAIILGSCLGVIGIAQSSDAVVYRTVRIDDTSGVATIYKDGSPISFGGNPYVEYSIEYATTFTLSITIIDTDYAFDHWVIKYTYDGETSNDYNASTTIRVDDDLEIWAVFGMPSYTVTFDATTNGGTLIGSPTKTVTNGQQYGTLPTATKPNYTFTGWFNASTGGTQITANSYVSLSHDQTLYAQFTPIIDTVQIDDVSGMATVYKDGSPISFGGNPYVQYSIQRGTSFTLSIGSIDSDYSFSHWVIKYTYDQETVNDYNNPTTITVDDDLEIWAVLLPVYMITWEN